MSRPLPGHAIPYTFPRSEALAFLNSSDHDNDADLQAYLESGGEPPWGVIIRGMTGNPTGEFLVWRDASGIYQVVDVTFLPIVQEVEKAPYHTPEESVIQNLMTRVREVTDAGLQVGSIFLDTLPYILGGFLMLLAYNEFARRQ